MAPKGKAIDLGALQDHYTEAKREHAKAKKAVETAQIHLQNSRKRLMEAHEELKQASAAVLE